MKTSKRGFWAVATSPLWILALPVVVFGTQVTIPNTFVSGTVADASQVNANFTALRTAFNNLHTTGGVILAAAHITGGVGPTVTRSFTNLPGAPAITVTRTAVGVYNVFFGSPIAARFYGGVHGNPSSGVPTAGHMDITPLGVDPSALFIRLFDSAGAPVDTNFFVEVH